MKKRTRCNEIKETIYEFDEYDIKRLILSEVNLSDSDSKTLTFAFTYKVNSDLSGAVVRIQYDKKEEKAVVPDLYHSLYGAEPGEDI
jgi:hypothetical protein